MSIHVVKVPDIGEGIAEVELVEWRVRPGDTVVADQPLADVMTDKATVEVPSPVASLNRTSSSGRSTGRDFSITALTTVKMVVFAPMPSARVIITTAAKIGRFTRPRIE